MQDKFATILHLLFTFTWLIYVVISDDYATISSENGKL